jgi:hypothetical protein
MNRSLLARSCFAILLSACTILAFVPEATAQWPRDDGFFFPFGPGPRRPPPFPREAFPRPAQPAPVQEPQGGTIYGSAEAADRHRATQAEQYVVVLGDSLADNLAQGLADAFFEERPEIAIVKKTRGSSGLVRADFYDWPGQAPGLLENEKANAIVIMLGANDRQTLRDDAGAYEIRSDRWREIYAQRVDALLNAVKSKGVPVILVGVPSMRHPRLHADMPYLNEVLRERATANGVLYVDVWDGFVNESDEFVTMGAALDGQTRRLRIEDGVHFTRVGARKLAHYVERDLIRLFDSRSGAPTIQIDRPDAQPQPTSPAGRPVAGPVLPLTQPAGPVGTLAGGDGKVQGGGNGTAARVLVEGTPAEPVAGRADDFRWPRPAMATAVEPSKTEPKEAKGGASAAPTTTNSTPSPAEQKAAAPLPTVITPTRNGPQVITVPETGRR